jgi:parvulin-like peptidyl-prolyl isomerase
VPAGSIAAVKRQLTGAVAALAILATGALATACDATPPAASTDGASISRGALNSQLANLQNSVAGACLLQLESSQLQSISGQGSGGSGTYQMAFAVAVLDNDVENLLAEQYAASLGMTVTSADLSKAKSSFESTLSGEISAAVTEAEEAGTVSYCQDASGSGITGAELLSALPESVQAAQIRNQAVDQLLLARGADLSSQAISSYYAKNQPLFTADCVSVIATDTQAHANQLIAQLNAGASFAAVAKANSQDTTTASNGGSLGCQYTEARVESALSQSSITVGKPIGPTQDSSSGKWIIYEVISQTVEPLSETTGIVKQELLQTTANVTRVSKEIVSFAKKANVSVDPQYGTWKRLTIMAPVAPPSQYLLAAVGGTSSTTSKSPLASLGSGATSGSGSTTTTTPSSGS